MSIPGTALCKQQNTMTTTTTATQHQHHHVTAGEYDKEDARGYKDAKHVAMRERVELYTTLNLVGDASGKRVIDVACGTGWLTRELKRQCNASYVMGTDLSPEMINLAKNDSTTTNNSGSGSSSVIDYVVEDIRNATHISEEDKFDVVTSNWLLVYARNRTELRSMCDGLAMKAKTGAKLVTIITDPDLYGYKGDLSFMKKYGFEFIQPNVVKEGEAITIKCYTPTGKFAVEIDNYYFTIETYLDELRKAGFKNVQTNDLQLSPSQNGDDDSASWNDFMSCPFVMAITAIKE